MMTKTKRKVAPAPMPTIDYSDFINCLARERARRQAASAEPSWLENNPDFEERKFRESLHFMKEDLAAWQALGNHYADVLADPHAPAALKNVIDDELLDLANQVKLHITSPEVLRLLYPLLRFRQYERATR